MSYLIRRVFAKPRLILDEICRLYGKFASYLRRVLCKTRLIFPRINGPIVYFFTFLYINFQKVLKGMKGEHVIDDTGDAKDTGAKGKIM